MGRQHILVILCMNSGKHIVQVEVLVLLLNSVSWCENHCLVFLTHKKVGLPSSAYSQLELEEVSLTCFSSR